MNDIVRPVTPDGDAGFDQFGQFFVWVPDPDGDGKSKIGRIRYDVRGQIAPSVENIGNLPMSV